MGKGDAKKNISVNFRTELVEKLDELSKRASKISGNNITRNAIIEEGVTIYVEEFEEYINNIYASYEDSGKYIEDKMKLPDHKPETKRIGVKEKG